VLWLTPYATEMQEADWNFPDGHFLSYVLGGPKRGTSPLYIVLNAAAQAIDFKLPLLADVGRWDMLLDTTHPAGIPSQTPDHVMQAPPRSVLVFAGAT
jgi:glycogen operon protein